MKMTCYCLLILFCFQILWPDGAFFLKVRSAQNENNEAQPNLQYSETASQFSGSKVSKPGSFEEQLEAARRASDVRRMLFGE